MSFPYINPISPIQLIGTQSVSRDKTYGTNYSTLSVGGYMEVYSLEQLSYFIPPITYGPINYSANTIPINFSVGSGSTFSYNTLVLNSDNISSGRKKLGMLVYVKNENQVYQFNINNYDSLWNAATGATGVGGSTVIISSFGTTVKANTPEGIAFISGWTANTIDGVSGYTYETAAWKKYYANNLAVTGGTYDSDTNILILTNITGGTVSISGFTSGGTSNPDITVGVTNIVSGFSGGVVFQSSTNKVQQSTNLFWDNTNGRLGVGTSNPSYRVDVTGLTLVNSSVSAQGSFNVSTLPAPPSITGFTLSAGSSLSVGTYYYRVVYVTSIGETNTSGNLTVITTTGNTTVNLSGIPISTDPRVTARKLYRTPVNSSVDNQRFLATISNNTTTTYTDTIPDASLGAVSLQAYKVNTTSRYVTVNGTQGMILDPNLTTLGLNAGSGIITSSGAAIRTVLIGASAGQSITTGQANIIVGVAGVFLTTGSFNTIMGDLSGYNLVGGSTNTLFGYEAGQNLTTGSGNLTLGSRSGKFLADGVTRFTGGTENTIVGNSIRLLTANDTNSIIIGSAAFGLGSNTTVIGNSSTTFSSIFGNLGVATTTNAGFRLDVNGTSRFNGLQTFQGTTSSDNYTLGSELATTASGTNWSGSSFATGYIHTVGSTSGLTSTTAAVINNSYQITLTITGRTAGSVTVSFGGVTTLGRNATVIFAINATTTGVLVITPTTDFDGTVFISLRQITASVTPISQWTNSSNSGQVELRTGGNTNLGFGFNAGLLLSSTSNATFNTIIGSFSGQKNISNNNTFIGAYAGQNNTSGGGSILPPGNGGNTFIGAFAGRNNTIGHSNAFFGSNAGNTNTSGSYNVFFGATVAFSNTTGSNNVAIGGYSALGANTIGSFNVALGAYALTSNSTTNYNTAIGSAALYSTTGSNNLGLGANSLYNSSTGSNNVGIGYDAGRFISDGVTSNINVDQSVYIGGLTKSNVNNTTNQIVIGYNATGIGTNSVVLGNDSIVRTALKGNVLIGTTTDAGYKLDVNGTARIQTSTISPTFSGNTLSSTGLYGSSILNAGDPNGLINIRGGNTRGGSSYLDFIRASNDTVGTINGSKTIRINNIGSMEFINDAYSSTIFSLGDNGANGFPRPASTVSNDATSNYLYFNSNASQIYDDGNMHIHSRSANQSLWINTNNGAIILGNQSSVSGGFAASSIIMGSSTTIKAYTNIYGSKTYTIGSYGFLSTGGAGTGVGTTAPYSLYCDNRIEASEFDATSDERMKNIQGGIELSEAIKLVTTIKPIKYTWKRGEDKGLKTGYSAQQVEKSGFKHLIGHIPNEDLVESTDEDGFTSPDGFQLTMNYDQVIPYHGVVINYLLDEIKNMKKEIELLKSK
jgi:trimeric autotransporter adhesin